MQKINIISIGKNKDKWVEEAILHYSKLLKKYASLTIDYIPGKKLSKNLSKKELCQLEAELIKPKLKSRYQIALSDKGKLYNSYDFSKWLTILPNRSLGACDFIIGGIYGLDDSFLKSCHDTISLSPLTMSHQIVRPVLLEQLYRGFSIISGSKYHK
ncbi:MAG: 23S rRNA (pseudouridine(1915)-N(3))-methyltransferase RlmH [candidate division Zixibacteria bacterium]|nr:23S rRNA (pseudouridine(1915)-N(3))-methyltransferase RlmH [candidate division Zixibacteria bacterium]